MHFRRSRHRRRLKQESRRKGGNLMKQYVAAKAERIELTLCENIAFSGGEIIPDRPPFVEIDPDDVPITN